MNPILKIPKVHSLIFVTIRYIGKPHFAKEIRYGIELEKRTAQGHDGTAGKFRYFTSEPGHGVFIDERDISSKYPFEVGSYVQLEQERRGFVRFFGVSDSKRYVADYGTYS